MMTKTQKIVSILSTLTIGAVGGHHIDDIVEKYNLEIGRYPMKVEYTITNSCLSSVEKPMSIAKYRKKFEHCICAFEETQFKYDYASYQLDENEFLDIFEESAKECQATRD